MAFQRVRRLAAALLTVALVLPALASAQTAPAKKSTAAKRPAATASSLAEPAPSARASDALGKLWVGGGVGLELTGLANAGAGPKLRLDAAYPVTQLAPQARLEIVGHLAYTYLPAHFAFPGVSVSASDGIFEIVPAARVVYAYSNVLSFYGDAGLGLGIVSTTAATDLGYYGGGVYTVSATSSSLLLRLAGGIAYSMSDRLRFTFEPIGLNAYLASGGFTDFSLFVGAQYRL